MRSCGLSYLAAASPVLEHGATRSSAFCVLPVHLRRVKAACELSVSKQCIDIRVWNCSSCTLYGLSQCSRSSHSRFSRKWKSCGLKSVPIPILRQCQTAPEHCMMRALKQAYRLKMQ